MADPKTLALLEVNAAAQKAYGYTREDFLALPLTEIIPENVIALMAAPADPQEGRPRFAGDWHHRRRDGTGIEVAIDAYTVDLGGRSAILVQAKDITGRVTYDRLLARLNENLQSFGPDPLENIDRLTALAGEVMEADSAVYNRQENGVLRVWGRWRALPDLDSAVASPGHISADVIAQGAQKPFVVRHLAHSAYATSDPNVPSYGLQTYVGQAVHVHGQSVGALCVVYKRDFEPKPDQARFLVIIATAVGAEEVRRELGESLRQREELYRRMYEASPVGILSVDGTGRIIRANGAFQRIIGYSEPELTRMTFNDFTHPDRPGDGQRSAWPTHRRYDTDRSRGEALHPQKRRCALGRRHGIRDSRRQSKASVNRFHRGRHYTTQADRRIASRARGAAEPVRAA